MKSDISNLICAKENQRGVYLIKWSYHQFMGAVVTILLLAIYTICNPNTQYKLSSYQEKKILHAVRYILLAFKLQKILHDT